MPAHIRHFLGLLLIAIGLFSHSKSFAGTKMDVSLNDASVYTLQESDATAEQLLHEAPELPVDPLRWAENEAFRRFRPLTFTPVLLFIPLSVSFTDWPPSLLAHALRHNGLSHTASTELPQPQHLAYIHRLHLM